MYIVRTATELKSFRIFIAAFYLEKPNTYVISFKYSNVIGFHSTFWPIPRVKWVATHSDINIRSIFKLKTQDSSKLSWCQQFEFRVFITCADVDDTFVFARDRKIERKEKKKISIHFSREFHLYANLSWIPYRFGTVL